MPLSPPRGSSDGAWVPGHHAAPDSLPTLTYYSRIGELCGAQLKDLERLGAHVVSTWLSVTVADHKANVTVANLRESLKECEIPASRHDSWIATISKYHLASLLSGAPAVLKAPREFDGRSSEFRVHSSLPTASSMDGKFTSSNALKLPPPGPAIAPENAVGRGFILPAEYLPYTRSTVPRRARILSAGWAIQHGPKQWLMRPATALDRGLPGCSGLPLIKSLETNTGTSLVSPNQALSSRCTGIVSTVSSTTPMNT